MAQRIVLIHATTVAIEPIRAAFAQIWPGPDVVGILDESLSTDRARSEVLTDAMTKRIALLGNYAIEIGADAILYTCSAFGSAIEAFAETSPVPTLKPNEAMFEQALSMGKQVAMVYTFAPAGIGMVSEFEAAARQADLGTQIIAVEAKGAMDAARKGDIATHDRRVAEAAAALHGFDAILLAHFSTATAAEAVKAVVDVPVLTSPHAAVTKLRSLLAASGC